MVDYPKDWEEIELGKKGKLLGGLTGKNKQDFINGNAKLITYKNVFANIFIDLKINDKVKINDNEKQNILEYGDVCFTGSSETLEESGMSSVLI
ncbi:MAG: restriction endonuclease subunit S, partial [Bacilli bacterium]|nr:restriction endonuclease subunit S [Bacilli bacterium]